MPMHIWETQTPDEKKADAASLVTKNNMLCKQAYIKQNWAQQLGTEEHCVLTKRNANIQEFN